MTECYINVTAHDYVYVKYTNNIYILYIKIYVPFPSVTPSLIQPVDLFY